MPGRRRCFALRVDCLRRGPGAAVGPHGYANLGPSSHTGQGEQPPRGPSLRPVSAREATCRLVAVNFGPFPAHQRASACTVPGLASLLIGSMIPWYQVWRASGSGCAHRARAACGTPPWGAGHRGVRLAGHSRSGSRRCPACISQRSLLLWCSSTVCTSCMILTSRGICSPLTSLPMHPGPTQVARRCKCRRGGARRRPRLRKGRGLRRAAGLSQR